VDDHHQEIHITLGRIDERLKAIKESQEADKVALEADMVDLKTAIKEYVSKVEFWPYKALLIGLSSLILSAVVAAIIAKVIH